MEKYTIKYLSFRLMMSLEYIGATKKQDYEIASLRRNDTVWNFFLNS